MKMELTREVFDKINELDYIFNDVETLSRVLKLYDNVNDETEYNDKIILIHLLCEKILLLKDRLDCFTSSLIQKS
jgi:hypothetical protein